MALAISKGLPAPVRQQSITETLRLLEVGDSFQVPCSESEAHRKRHSIRVMASALGISVRTGFSDNVIHVWRAA